VPGDDAPRSLPLDVLPHLVESVAAVAYVLRVGHVEDAPLYVSPQALEVIGVPADALRADGEARNALMHPEDRQRIREAARDNDRLDAGRWDQEYRLRQADGSYRWVRDQASILPPQDGRPALWVGVVTDASGAHGQRASSPAADGSPFRTLVETLPAIVYIDSHERAPTSLYVSPQTTEITGYAPQEWLADRELWWKLLHPDDRERMRRAWSRAHDEGSLDAEYRLFRRDGQIIWMEDVATLVRADDGTPLFWQGIAFDVTDRKDAERALAESEARYRALVEQIPAAVYRMRPDDDRRTLYVSPYVEEVLGYTRQEWLDQPDIWVELLHPDDREIELDAHDRLTQTGDPWIQEYRLIANDGRVVWVRDQAILTTDADGQPVWHGVLLDITALKDLEHQLRGVNDMLELRVLERTTELEDANELMTLEIEERRRVEGELREARERYRHLVEDLPAVVYLWQVRPHDPPLVYTSPQIERLLGYTPEEWNHPTFWASRLHPHDRDRVIAATERSSATGDPFEQEFRYFAKDGRIVWVRSHASLLRRDERGRPLLFQGVLLDLTSQKEAELEATDVVARFEAVTTLAPVAFYDFEIREGEPERIAFRSVSPMLAHMIGMDPEEFARDPTAWLRSIHPDDRDAVTADSLEQLRSGRASTRSYRVIGPEGIVSWVRSESRSTERAEDGRPTRIQGAIVDVTREMRENERLRRSEERLRRFVDTIPGLPWIRMVEGPAGAARLRFVGPQAQQILGYTPAELLAQPDPLTRMIHPDDRPRIEALWALHDRNEEPYWAEYRVRRRDGAVAWLRSQALASRDARGRLVWHGVSYDVSPEHAETEPNAEAPRAPLEDVGPG
jgi:adenylate cyclase